MCNVDTRQSAAEPYHKWSAYMISHENVTIHIEQV